MKITRHSKEFLDAAKRVESGELTRVEAAGLIGVNPGTFAVWMSRSGIYTARDPDGARKLHGAALGWASTDPDKAKALEQAVADVLDGKMSSSEAARRNPGLSLVSIAARVRKQRLAMGMFVQTRRTKEEIELSRLKLIE